MLSEKCQFLAKEKKMTYIEKKIDNIEISSDFHEENFHEENFDKKKI